MIEDLPVRVINQDQDDVGGGLRHDGSSTSRAPMGTVASRLGDINIITTDDAYSEDPQAIADEVMSGADSSNTAVVLERRGHRVEKCGAPRAGDPDEPDGV